MLFFFNAPPVRPAPSDSNTAPPRPETTKLAQALEAVGRPDAAAGANRNEVGRLSHYLAAPTDDDRFQVH